jgi:hypothetical protein
MGPLHVIYSRFCTYLKWDSFTSFANTNNFQLKIVNVHIYSQYTFSIQSFEIIKQEILCNTFLS